ncbi:MAG: hypothetical protein ATN33_00365 [Epulopiscium sp. Nele67-Bin001]|nr:MAG: hypothetical protein ATN33_00365 [Epulopiscium sp. Nele67-Bin001]
MYIGIDIGYSSIKYCVVNDDKQIKEHKVLSHKGNMYTVLDNLLIILDMEYPLAKVSFTGAGARFANNANFVIHDVKALATGAVAINPSVNAIMDIGAYRTKYIADIPAAIEYGSCIFNSECSSGSGVFFEDQMHRLGLSIEDYGNLIDAANTPVRISGKCSVFSKTDIIHRQQEGNDICEILLGLAYATVNKYKALVVGNIDSSTVVMFCGGCAKNKGIIRATYDVFNIPKDRLIYNDDTVCAKAFGCALLSGDNNISISEARHILKRYRATKSPRNTLAKLQKTNPDNDVTNSMEVICSHYVDGMPVSLGIDIGSTSTNFVLISEVGEIVYYDYRLTKGSSKDVIQRGFNRISKLFGNHVNIVAVGVTGSGRHLVGNLIGADLIIDEITAQAKAAYIFNEFADTVIEIGGQDSKFISMTKGVVTNFQMNRVCSAGTGSFLEEQVNKLDIPLSQYSELAFKSESPIDLGERCTVFIETNIKDALADGYSVEDVLAGLCHCVVKNYLNKVVGKCAIGNTIVLQGGTCYNEAFVAAFKQQFGDKIHVSPYFAISGAFGVAKLALESMSYAHMGINRLGFCHSAFRGLQLQQFPPLIASNVNKYHNHFLDEKKLFLEGYKTQLDPKKKTIGIPNTWINYKVFPLFNAFFTVLGFNVLLSPETDSNIAYAAQMYAGSEMCYPIKLLYGHIAWLLDQEIDYLFIPSLLTVDFESSTIEKNYMCVYMQSSIKILYEQMNINNKVELINPQIKLDHVNNGLSKECIKLGVSLGKSKARSILAVNKASYVFNRYIKKVEEDGRALLDSLKSNDKVFVIISRVYNTGESALNLEIPSILMDRGYMVLSVEHLSAFSMDLSDEYPNLYWPFGAHILTGAKYIVNHPNLYAILLTNHGCAPDTALLHLFQEEMSEKPFLHIEVDEHFSRVGAITRIEAFINSINARPTVTTTSNFTNINCFANLPKRKVNVKDSPDIFYPLYIPNLYPFSQIAKDKFKHIGIMLEPLPETTAESLTAGTKFALSKEYISFTQLLGDIIASDAKQVFIPQTEGAELDGVYARVIAGILTTMGSSINIITGNANSEFSNFSPTIEVIFRHKQYFDRIFYLLIAGDIILAAPKQHRYKLVEWLIGHRIITMKILKELAILASMCVIKYKHIVNVIGDPYVIYNQYFISNVEEHLAQHNIGLRYQSLTEYMIYLWYKRAESKDEKDFVQFAHLELLEAFGPLSCVYKFEADLKTLAKVGENQLPLINGGNAQYRIAKKLTTTESSGIIEFVCMYEHVQNLIALQNAQAAVPSICIGVEQTQNYEDKLKPLLDRIL